MYATIDVQFGSRVHVQRLVAGLPHPSPLQIVVAQTNFLSYPAAATPSLYSHLSASTATLILPVSDNELQVHVENVQSRASISELKVDIERTLRAIQDAAKNSKQKIKRMAVAIFAEQNRITAGMPGRYASRVWQRFKDTIAGDVLAAAAPVIPMWFLDIDREKIGLTVLVVLIILAAWLFIEAGKRGQAVVYEDV